MRAVRARIFALLAALVMLLPSGASARTQYYCRMMGQIVGSTSCDHEAVSQVGPVQQIQEADCCQRLSSSSRTASLGTHEAVRSVAAAALLTTTPQPLGVGLQCDTDSFCGESTQAPLAIGPPLFIVHCAFLS